MPSVVRVIKHFKRERIRIKFSRLNIYARDGFTCGYCRERLPTEDLNFDHVIPRAQGGKTIWENIVTCCIECNRQKANRTPAEAGMTLHIKPKKPKFLPAITVRMPSSEVPTEWRTYWQAGLES